MNLLHLRYFHVVASEGGFTKASKKLRIQQPAISRMVGHLEDSLGQPLLEKIGRNVHLTTFGKEVFEHSERIFAEVDRLEKAAIQRQTAPDGPLAFAASEPIASHFVPNVLSHLLRTAPSVYPQVYSGPASMLFERILNGELEFGLFFHVPEPPPRLQVKILKKIRFHLVVRKDLARKDKTLESFIGSREIDDVSTRTFPTLTKLKRIHPSAKIRISSNNLTAHRSLVLLGLGVAVLPDFLVGDDLQKKALVDVLPDEVLEFDLKIVVRKGGLPGRNAEAFFQSCAKI